MSARKAVENLLWWSVPGSDNEESKTRAARMLDAYRDEVAHELAEKIRERATSRAEVPRTWLTGRETRDDWAADWIDPEVDDD